jgi:hypothetical protein
MFQPRIPPHASVLFAPYELAIYDSWRTLCFHQVNVSGITPVPTASEYADFQRWRAGERAKKLPKQKSPAPDIFETTQCLEENADESVLAEKCKHPLHPARSLTVPDEEGHVIEPIPWCPTRTLEHNTALISALYTNWTELGGPWRNAALASEEERKTYSDTNRAYQRARVALVNTMATFETMAHDEEV